MDKQLEKRFYGRRQGRPLNASRKEAMDALLPVLSVPGDVLREDGALDPSSLFDAPIEECWFEIGFGAGEHLSALMRREPETGFLGAEPYINGMSSFLKDILPLMSSRPTARSAGMEGSDQLADTQDPSALDADASAARDDRAVNVRVIMDDAMMLANSLCDGCLDGIYVLNPDPWHKVRHHKRRMINPDNLDCFARILKPGGQLIMSTDVPYLAEWMVTHSCAHPAFEWEAECANDWRVPPDDWVHTAYETKKAKGADKMCYLMFKRKV